MTLWGEWPGGAEVESRLPSSGVESGGAADEGHVEQQVVLEDR